MSLRTFLRDWLGVRRELLPPAPSPSASIAPRNARGVSDSAVAEMSTGGDEAANAFALPAVAPGVFGPDDKGRGAGEAPRARKMAMDDAVAPTLNWAALNQTFNEGVQFMGYPYLAELTQRAEYRRPADILAKSMTRKWIKFVANGEDVNKTERIKQLQKEFERLDVKSIFRQAVQKDAYFGRAQIYIDLGVKLDDKGEIGKPIAIDAAKVARGSLKRLTLVEPMWSYPMRYNTTDPLDKHFYKPETWMVMGSEVHHSRLLTVVGNPVPDILKPSYAFGGLSLSQMAKPYVDNWLRTRQSVSDLIWSFTVWILKTDMGVILNGGGATQLKNRMALFNRAKTVRGVAAVDKEMEDIENVSAPLSGLDSLQAQTQEHMSAVTGIPLSILLGITPQGLNASNEGEIRTFYDWIEAQQENVLDEHLRYVMNVAMLNLWGEVDDDITYQWEPLWTMTEKERAELKKAKAEERTAYIDAGVVDPAEVRRVVANEEDSEFAGIDVDKVPEPPGGEPDDEEMRDALKTAEERDA